MTKAEYFVVHPDGIVHYQYVSPDEKSFEYFEGIDPATLRIFSEMPQSVSIWSRSTYSDKIILENGEKIHCRLLNSKPLKTGNFWIEIQRDGNKIEQFTNAVKIMKEKFPSFEITLGPRTYPIVVSYVIDNMQSTLKYQYNFKTKVLDAHLVIEGNLTSQFAGPVLYNSLPLKSHYRKTSHQETYARALSSAPEPEENQLALKSNLIYIGSDLPIFEFLNLPIFAEKISTPSVEFEYRINYPEEIRYDKAQAIVYFDKPVFTNKAIPQTKVWTLKLNERVEFVDGPITLLDQNGLLLTHGNLIIEEKTLKAPVENLEESLRISNEPKILQEETRLSIENHLHIVYSGTKTTRLCVYYPLVLQYISQTYIIASNQPHKFEYEILAPHSRVEFTVMYVRKPPQIY